MSLSTLKPVTCRLTPAGGPNVIHSKLPKVAMVNRQALPRLQVTKEVKEKEKTLLQEASRREMIHLTAATLGLLSLLSPASAEARPRNTSMRQKILEKLEDLRRKAGLSKPNDEEVDKKSKDEDEKSKPKNEKEENKPKPRNEAEEKKSKSKETSIPVLPHILNGNTVESTLP